MTPEKQQELNQHLDAIAKILYAEAEEEKCLLSQTHRAFPIFGQV